MSSKINFAKNVINMLYNPSDFCITDIQVKQLVDYWDLLLDYNQFVNVISRKTSYDEGFINHVVDSISIMSYKNYFSDNYSYMDLGSGGGFPAIPLKIVNPGWDMVLVESTGKKAAFLRMAVEKLKLKDVTVVNTFLKPNSFLLGKDFDLITTRGFSSLASTLPLVSPFLRSKGLFIAYKGRNIAPEINNCQKIVDNYNMYIASMHTYELPLVNKTRNLLHFARN
jgi:16S rRNA (guanine527-N7)-methyltransferase